MAALLFIRLLKVFRNSGLTHLANVCYSTPNGTQGATIERGIAMENFETLKAVYEQKQAKYQALCDAAAAAYEAHQAIKAMCDEAMADMHKAGQEMLEAMSKQQ